MKPMIKYLYAVIEPESGRLFFNKPSFYPTYSFYQKNPYRDPFTDDLDKVKLHLSMKGAEKTATALTESYDHALRHLRSAIDRNVEDINKPPPHWVHLNDPAEMDRYIQGMKDDNGFYYSKIDEILEARPKTIKACKITAMCLIT